MSTIPTGTRPPADPAVVTEEGGETLTMARRAADLAQSARAQAGRLFDYARGNPKTTIAAGAALAAGAAAAATIPLVRAKRRSAANGSATPKAAATKAPARKRAAPRKSPAKKS